jgi:hypothetical protein
LPTPQKYERKPHKLKSKKEMQDANKHYLRFSCDAKELVIYDKSYQLVANGLVVEREEIPDGVLRFEVQYGREYIRRAEKSLGQDVTTKLLRYFIKSSQALLCTNFSHCFPDVTFCRLDEISARIKASSFKKETKEAMCTLALELQRKQSVDKALKELQKRDIITDDLLEHFNKLGISPIPLWSNFCAKQIPRPVELLRSISTGKVPVAYEKVKFK